MNDTLDWSTIPGSGHGQGRRLKANDRDIEFFLNSDFDFQKQIWWSGFLKIPQKDWAIANTPVYKYPILGNGFKTRISVHLIFYQH